jgi:D-sedoheptulose 7-phosphate isomerase
MSKLIEQIRAQIEESCKVKQSFSPELLARIAQFTDRAAAALLAGKKLVFFGNGGSAADAQHLAAELTVRLRAERPGIAGLALTTNTSVLTAAGNDYGFEQIFARQVESLVEGGDVVVALSTSGNSPNVLRGAEAAHKRGAVVVALTGETGGELAARADLLINVPSQDPQRIQEAHITIGHIVCSLLEQPGSERRRSRRVLVQLPIVVRGQNAEEKPFEEETHTLVVNAHGCLVLLAAPLREGQKVVLRNKATQEEQPCSVIHIGKVHGGKLQVGLEFTRAAQKFWHIAFPRED